MKTIKIALFTIGVFLLYNCNKSDEIKPSQIFLDSFFADSLYKKPRVLFLSSNTVFYELGMEFKVFKAGNIIKVAVRCPKSGTYKITLWDADNLTIIFSKSIEQEQPNVKKWIEIDPVRLTTNQKYAFTVLSNNWNLYEKKDSNPLPYNKDNFLYISSKYAETTAGKNKYPNKLDTFSSILGDVDFTFQPD
ncbi:MAG: hypothetical protein ACRCVT_11920 [Leadbetterella sp.]